MLLDVCFGRKCYEFLSLCSLANIFLPPLQVEVVQKKIDDFQADITTNETRLSEINEMVLRLDTIGKCTNVNILMTIFRVKFNNEQVFLRFKGETDVRVKLEGQIRDLNEKWSELHKKTQDNADKFERAHEVQRFHRDIEETKDWIQEKTEAVRYQSSLSRGSQAIKC